MHSDSVSLAALGGQRVALVDCDLRRRALNRVLNIHPRVGLLEVLAGQRSWRDVCGVDEPSGAHVIPLAETALTPRDMFSLPAMEDLLNDLRGNYDLIILDLATEGNYIACRPSGTEPKIKFYLFTFTPPEQLSNLELAKSTLERRLDQMETDLRKFAGV